MEIYDWKPGRLETPPRNENPEELIGLRRMLDSIGALGTRTPMNDSLEGSLDIPTTTWERSAESKYASERLSIGGYSDLPVGFLREAIIPFLRNFMKLLFRTLF